MKHVSTKKGDRESKMKSASSEMLANERILPIYPVRSSPPKGPSVARLSAGASSNGVSSKTEKVFIKVFDEFAPKLYRFCVLRVGSKESAEDLVSQTFLGTWRYLEGGGIIRSYPAFLYQALRNGIADHWRGKRAGVVSLDELQADMFIDFEDPEHSPERANEAINNSMEIKGVLAAMKQLPSAERDILHWRFVDDLSIKDIVELSGKKPNAIYVSIHRGLQKLKQALGGNNNYV